MPNVDRKDINRPGGARAVAWAAKNAAKPPPVEGPGQGHTEPAPITLPRVAWLEEPEE